MNESYNVFQVGKRYRVKNSFTDGRQQFVANEILEFWTWGFIPFIECYGYQFHVKNDFDGATDKAWLLPASKPPETWEEFFEPIN